MALIELRNIFKRFGWLVVLNGVTLNIEKGQSLVVIGASGSGKSVLLKHIVGLLKPDRGEVYFGGRRIDNLSERQLTDVRKHFGFLFQMGALFDSETVANNVAFPLVEHTKKSPAEIAEIVKQKLTMVGLPDAGPKMPAELEVILYDEPTTGLDPVRSDIINELIIRLQRQLSVTSVVVTHDMHSAFKVGDRIVMLHEGKLIFDGSPEKIRASDNPIIRRFIVGEADEKELESLTLFDREETPGK
jgi:phospholipid/cholesterol/gamma-HCH transport system ATP-binding protein